MSLVVMGRKADGTVVELPITVDGKLDVSASVAAPEGGATEAKQDDMIAALAGGLPLALTAGGGVKVGVVDALPAGTATIGAVTGPSAAALALDATVSTLSAKIPTAGALADNLSNPTTTLVGACMMGWASGTSQWRRVPVSSAGNMTVIADPSAPSSRSASTSLQTGRNFASFSAVPRVVRVWSSVAGYIALFNKASAATTGDTPHGALIFPIEAGEHLTIEFDFAITFTTGISAAHLTQVVSGGALSTVVSGTACAMFECQYT